MSSVVGAISGSTNMYLTQALEAINYVQSRHYNSSNRGAELDGLDANASASLGSMSNAIYRAVHASMIDDLGRSEEDLAIGSLLAPVVTAHYTRFANCEARAGIAFLHLVKNGVKPVEYLAFTEADHVFLILNRRQGANLADPACWGEDAVICDPWINDACMAGELRTKIANNPLLKELIGEAPIQFSGGYESTSANPWPPNNAYLRRLCKDYNIGA